MIAPRKQLNFLRGWPTPPLLPTSLLSAACQRILADPVDYTEMQEYGSCHGLTRLRKGLADWLGRHYDVNPDPERICITAGASQNLVSILQCFSDVNYTRAVWVVAPCYHLACGIFEDSGFAGRLHSVPEDDEGLSLEIFERATMSLDRREGLVKLARRYDALIISDDVYDLLQWSVNTPVTSERPSEMRLPRLCDIDRTMGYSVRDPHGFGHTVSNGSFSKIAGPSLRTGWAEGSPVFIAGIAHAASTRSGGAPSQLCAAILAELIENGRLQEFVDKRVRPALQRRHNLMMKAIATHLSPLGVKTRIASLKGYEIYGGYFVWLEVNSHFSTKFFADMLRSEEDIVIGYGDMFAVRGDEKTARFPKSIRLSFSWEAEEDIIDGVKRIGQMILRMHQRKEYYLELAARSLG
ncbi:hypothetical protein PWT90_01277 [Aphanocladium album]|nr:hypothetical protein PWT90_01277 [Aphanocladium album]